MSAVRSGNRTRKQCVLHVRWITCSHKYSQVFLDRQRSFFSFFSDIVRTGLKTPFTPHKYLYTIWKHADSFAGYEQQVSHFPVLLLLLLLFTFLASALSPKDAHEFMITALNGIHSHSGGATSSSAQPSLTSSTANLSGEKCSCVVHRYPHVFSFRSITSNGYGYVLIVYSVVSYVLIYVASDARMSRRFVSRSSTSRSSFLARQLHLQLRRITLQSITRVLPLLL